LRAKIAACGQIALAISRFEARHVFVHPRATRTMCLVACCGKYYFIHSYVVVVLRKIHSSAEDGESKQRERDRKEHLSYWHIHISLYTIHPGTKNLCVCGDLDYTINNSYVNGRDACRDVWKGHNIHMTSALHATCVDDLT